MRVVRCSSRPYGCGVVYTQEGGYFKEDEFKGPEWQFGRDYYDLQVLYGKVERGEPLNQEEAKKVITKACSIMHRFSYLLASYNSALEVLYGRAEFRD